MIQASIAIVWFVSFLAICSHVTVLAQELSSSFMVDKFLFVNPESLVPDQQMNFSLPIGGSEKKPNKGYITLQRKRQVEAFEKVGFARYHR